ncbi:MAG: hypothetical protein L0Z62_49015 [Gemmataceae bacterium]|nr:hypothetical protein [Gemmataceae bacterium]
MPANKTLRPVVKTLFILLGCAVFIALAVAASTAVVEMFVPRGAPSPLRWLVPLLAGCVVAFLCLLAWRQYAQAQQRQRGLSERAAEVSRALGFVFHEEMPAERWASLSGALPYKDRPADRYRNLMEGHCDGVAVLLFDFYPDSSNPQRHETFVLFPERDERLPDFLLQPKGLADRLLGHKGFVFDPGQAGDAHAAHVTERFAQRYTLEGNPQDEPALRQVFRTGTLEALTHHPGWGGHAIKGVLLLGRCRHGGTAEERPAFLREALHLRRLLCPPTGEESAPAPVALSGTRLSLRRAVLLGLGELLAVGLVGGLMGACAGYVVGFFAGAVEGKPQTWAKAGAERGAAVGAIALPVLLVLGQGLKLWARRHHAAAELQPPGDVPTRAPLILRHGLLIGIWVIVAGVSVIPLALGVGLGSLVAGWCLPLVEMFGGGPDRWATPLTVALGGLGGLLGLALPWLVWRKARRKGPAKTEDGAGPGTAI